MFKTNKNKNNVCKLVCQEPCHQPHVGIFTVNLIVNPFMMEAVII